MRLFLKRLLAAFSRGHEPDRKRSRFHPVLEELDLRQLMSYVPNITFHGGPIIPNVQVEAIFYGSAWTNLSDPNYPQLHVLSSDIQNYLGTLTNSDYIQGLSEYTGVD